MFIALSNMILFTAEVHVEQTDDEDDEPDVIGRPVSIALHAESKKDGSGQEFHLQLETDTTAGDVDSKEDFVQSSTTVTVNVDTSQAKVLLTTISCDPLMII